MKARPDLPICSETSPTKAKFKSSAVRAGGLRQDAAAGGPAAGALEHLEDGSVVLRDIGLYTQTTGLTLEPSGGNALFIG